MRMCTQKVMGFLQKSFDVIKSIPVQDKLFSTGYFTSKKLTKFHLWDVLKLKKRIIFHFRLFHSIFGHLKKKVQKLLKK